MTRDWRAVSATRKGSTHVRDDLPNQDAHLVEEHDGTAIMAVADGHGHQLHFRSEVGSALAAGTATHLLREALPTYTGANHARVHLRETLGPALVEAWSLAVQADITAHPFSDDEATRLRDDDRGHLRPYGSTVIAMAANAHVLVVLQIGDGDAVVVQGDGTVLRPLPEDELLHGMTTTSLCQVDPLASLRTVAIDLADHDIELGFIATDGFGRPRVDAETWWQQTGEELLERHRNHGLAWIEQRLPGWLTEPAEYGGDDVSLAVLSRSSQTPAGPAPTA